MSLIKRTGVLFGIEVALFEVAVIRFAVRRCPRDPVCVGLVAVKVTTAHPPTVHALVVCIEIFDEAGLRGAPFVAEILEEALNVRHFLRGRSV